MPQRSAARSAALALTLLLLLLLTASALLWWRLQSREPEQRAATAAASSILALQESSEQLSSPVFPTEAIRADLEAQLAALPDPAVESARETTRAQRKDAAAAPSESPGQTTVSEQMTQRFENSAQQIHQLTTTDRLAEPMRTLLSSIASQHWLTAQRLQESPQDAARKPPTAHQGLFSQLDQWGEILGYVPGPAPAQTWCGEDHAEQLLEQLDYAVWTEQSLAARNLTGKPGSQTAQRFEAARTLHEQQRDELRAGLEQHCGQAPPPQAAFDPQVPADTSTWLDEQSSLIARQSMALLRSTQGQQHPAEEARAWSEYWMSTATALGAAQTPALPALPGLCPTAPEHTAEADRTAEAARPSEAGRQALPDLCRSPQA